MIDKNRWTPELQRKEEVVLINLAHNSVDLILFMQKGYGGDSFRHPVNRLILKFILYLNANGQALSTESLYHIQQSKNYIEEHKASAIVKITSILAEQPKPLFNDLLLQWEEEVMITDAEDVYKKGVEYFTQIRDKNISVLKGFELMKKDLTDILKINAVKTPFAVFGQDEEKELQLVLNRQYTNLLPTGFRTLDRSINGLPAGFIYLFGPQKQCKSIFVSNLANTALSLKRRVLFFVNEGGEDMVKFRLAANHLKIPYSKFNSGHLDATEQQQYKDFSRQMKELLIIDSHIPTESNAGKLKKTLEGIGETYGKVDLVICDTFTYMQPTEVIKSRWEALDHVASELSGIATDFDVPLIGVGHSNRDGLTAKDLETQHMAGSIGPTRNAVMYASWKIEDFDSFKRNGMGTGKLSILGNRTGESPSLELDVNANICEIKEPAYLAQVVPVNITGKGLY